MNKPIRLASWNVNSLSIRLEQVLSLLDNENIDILALQETKIIDEKFPLNDFTTRGFHVSFSGQKTYNGVATISREPLLDTITDLPFFIDSQRRILAATIGKLRLINLYVPNGSSVESEKYQYKLNWLENITKFINEEKNKYPSLAVVGDFNIAPEDRDVHDINEWQGQVLVSEPERKALEKILALGLHDSFRKFPQEKDSFSWWDYRAANFRRNRGLRIDLILLSTPVLEKCSNSEIAKEFRKLDRPSDHAPVIVTIKGDP